MTDLNAFFKALFESVNEAFPEGYGLYIHLSIPNGDGSTNSGGAVGCKNIPIELLFGEVDIGLMKQKIEYIQKAQKQRAPAIIPVSTLPFKN